MAAEIKLTKSDDSHWGFRLTGGRDFGTPLTIIKVAVNSVAEEAGLQVGDILVKINDVDSHSLTHKEAQDLIIDACNAITFAVLRGSLNLPEAVIDRLTPLPLRDFKTPERNLPHQKLAQNIETCQDTIPNIEIIPIKDLEPDQLEELGLVPLPEDFLEKAKRDPSPMPEVRPQSRMADAPDVLDALEELGLHDVVLDIERQKEIVFASPPPQEAEVVDVSGEPSENSQGRGDAPAENSLGTPSTASAEPPASQEEVAIAETEFAEFMSGQEEVLQVAEGKSTLGVDFKKYEPQEDFIRKSQVFQTLQDNDKIITREEKDRRWTTFLDKPKRPRIKPRPKQTKPAVEVKQEPIPEPEIPPEPRQGLYEIPSEEEFEALVKVPTPTPTPQTEHEEADPTDEELTQQLLEEQQNLQEQLEIEKQMNPETFGVEKSEVEMQLEEIQRQLQAIQQLPFEIQQHLALVQEQLNKIVQNRSQDGDGNSAPRPSMVEEMGLSQGILENLEVLPLLEETTEQPDDSSVQEQPPAEILSTEQKTEFKLRTEEDPPILPPSKKEKPRKKRPFLGLGPAPRPLILPGGRRWRTPKDAYNDEFIAETLSAQAEIITGSTLGVNFKKYEPKLPNLQHLRDSVVYKMIHDLEDPDTVSKGLASRPEIVPALQDYNRQTTPAAI